MAAPTSILFSLYAPDANSTTMQRVVLEGFAESTSVLREEPDQDYGA